MNEESKKIFEKHMGAIDRTEISYGEKKAQDERVLKDDFILGVGAILHKHGIQYSYEGKCAAKAALRRLEREKNKTTLV